MRPNGERDLSFNRQHDHLRGWQRSFAVVVSLVVAGCSIQLDEISTSEPVTLTEASDQCFSEAATTFDTYFEGVGSPQSVQSSFLCLRSAIDLFEKYARSQTGARDFYTSTEIRMFLRDTFAPQLGVSEGLWIEIMRLKQLAIGGETDRIRRTELQSIRELFTVFEEEALRLQPWVRLLTMKMSQSEFDSLIEEQGEYAFDEAVSAFKMSVPRLARILATGGGNYSLIHLESFLKELDLVFGDSWSGPRWALDQLGLLSAAKALALDADGSQIQAKEWTAVGDVVSRVYSIVLRFHYLLADKDLFFGEGLSQLDTAVGELNTLVAQAIQRKPNQVISYQLINDFVEQLTGAVVGPELRRRFVLPLTAPTIQQLAPVLLGRLVTPLILGEGEEQVDPNDPETVFGYRPLSRGLEISHLNFMFERFRYWVSSQRKFEQIEALYMATQQPPTSFLAKFGWGRMTSPLSAAELPLDFFREQWLQVMDPANPVEQDIGVLLSMPIPPSTEADGTMMFKAREAITYTRKSFSDLNWKQLAVRLIGNGYVSDPVAHQYRGILLSQFEQVFLDFKNLAVDLDFIEPEEQSIYKTGFFVSSVFLFSSDGDDRLSFQEAVDLFVVSFGTDPVRAPVNDAVALNCAPITPTPFGTKPWYQADCWRFHYRLIAPNSFLQVPGWGRELSQYSDPQWDLLIASLAQASRQPNSIAGTVQPAEMSRPFSVQLYIEALFTRWDTDRDLILSFSEAEAAYPLFFPLLKQASGLPDEDVLAVYAWVLANGRPPTSLAEKVRFQTRWRRAGRDVWAQTANADRLRVAQIFGALAAEISK